jgi:transposase
VDLRELKALELAARCPVIFEGGVWLVPSQSSPGQKYRVALGEAPSCECDDFQLRQQPCKHIICARLVAEREGRVQAPPLDTNTLPKRPTYRQNWGAYNEAQITEKRRLQVLLAELCKDVPEPRSKGGRPRTPLADVLFACAFKVYCTLSSRRFGTDLAEAYAKGYLSRPLHPNKVNCHLENPDLSPLLRDLIVRSSLPLRLLETKFAPDSSGFSCSRFVRWFDEKYGVNRSNRDWVKVHIMTGVKTNIVTAIEIHDRDAADAPQFKPLLASTAEHFTVAEVSADKAYSSLENVAAVDELGAFPAIAFKSNATGAVGGAFARLFYYYQFHREDFLKTYHQRSNVESTFSMTKAKFGDAVRSRTDPAMKNEVLCKFLCHNLCCVLLSQIELGIEATFWKEKPDGDEAVILPLVQPR